ncbi:MAG TPA: cytochrome C [Anaeromyxobacter sp.]
MKGTKIAVAAVFALMSGRVYAFHSGGVAECEGCHTMHNSSAESVEPFAPQMTLNNLAVGQTNPFLLQGQDQSSTCLRCHSNKPPGSYHILSADQANKLNALDPTQLNYTPGGDFAWTLNKWSYTGYEGPADQAGERAGHNVKALDFSMNLDARQAPPGSGTNGADIGWDGTNFACTSCHDPHGRYRYTSSTAGTFVTSGPAITGSGSYADSRGGAINYASKITATATVGAYRILGGQGYVPKSGNGPSAGFLNSPPIALAPSTYNISESPSGTLGRWAAQVQVAYGQGMSEWCSNCHPKMHSNTIEGATVTGLTKHPAGNSAKFNSAMQANYNGYISSGNFNGTLTDQYDALVPFEQGSSDLDAIKTGANKPGYNNAYVPVVANASSNVMCLSCHRAHASAFNFSTRWYNDQEFVTTTGSTYTGWALAKGPNTSGAMNATVTQAGYYQRPYSIYGGYQRSLCNKCHGKD